MIDKIRHLLLMVGAAHYRTGASVLRSIEHALVNDLVYWQAIEAGQSKQAAYTMAYGSN
jgi:3-deoxy-D-arabino-heptulosonate 7-phosphate (DAHP) synthase